MTTRIVMPPFNAPSHLAFPWLGTSDMSGPEEELRAALRTDQFRVHWQPVVTCDSGDLLGFEALIRWDRPGIGEVLPRAFIPIIERLDLHREFDRWMLHQACAAAAHWPGYSVSVNISAQWFSGSGLVACVATALERFHMEPARLELEVDESVMRLGPTAVQNLTSLKGLGVRLALDDFGSGQALLGILQDMPFDKLKLDQAFVRRLGQCRRTEAIVRAMLQLGNALNLTICAEGVERPEQLAILQAYGCHEVQGYLIGKPRQALPDMLDFYDRLDRSMLFMAASRDCSAIAL